MRKPKILLQPCINRNIIVNKLKNYYEYNNNSKKTYFYSMYNKHIFIYRKKNN